MRVFIVLKILQTIVEGCAYAASGNVLKVQEMLAICTEATIAAHEESEQSDEDSSKKKHDLRADPVAVIAIGLISIGEELGAQMALRQVVDPFFLSFLFLLVAALRFFFKKKEDVNLLSRWRICKQIVKSYFAIRRTRGSPNRAFGSGSGQYVQARSDGRGYIVATFARLGYGDGASCNFGYGYRVSRHEQRQSSWTFKITFELLLQGFWAIVLRSGCSGTCLQD